MLEYVRSLYYPLDHLWSSLPVRRTGLQKHAKSTGNTFASDLPIHIETAFAVPWPDIQKRVGKYYHPHWSILIPTRWSVLVVSNEPAMCNPLQSQTNRNLSIVHGSMDISTGMNYATRPWANSCQYHECQHRSGNALLTCEVGGL